MSSGAVKGIEVLLIAGAVFWFAYSQLNALKKSKPTDTDTDKADSATKEKNGERSDGGGQSPTPPKAND